MKINSINTANYKTVLAPVSKGQAGEISLLRTSDIPNLPHSKNLFIFAHPDDETLFGVISSLIDRGESTQTVYATSGDQGQDKRGLVSKGAQLAKVREDELIEAAKQLKYNRSPLMLNLKDGDLSKPEVSDLLIRHITNIIEKVKPEVVYTFGDDGITGHPDHITTGNITLRAVKAYNTSHPQAKIKLYQVAIDNDDARLLKNVMGIYTNAWDSLKPVSPDKVQKTYLTTGNTGRMLSAIAKYPTQFDENEKRGFSFFFRVAPVNKYATPLQGGIYA